MCVCVKINLLFFTFTETLLSFRWLMFHVLRKKKKRNCWKKWPNCWRIPTTPVFFFEWVIGGLNDRTDDRLRHAASDVLHTKSTQLSRTAMFDESSTCAFEHKKNGILGTHIRIHFFYCFYYYVSIACTISATDHVLFKSNTHLQIHSAK